MSNTPETFIETLVAVAGRLAARAATHGGARHPLGWAVDRFLLAMADELEAQGVPRRVAGDMLGVSRRTLQRRMQTARVTAELRRRTVWSRIYQCVELERPTALELEGRIRGIPARVVASVCRDMLESGWLQERKERLVARPRGELGRDELVAMLQACWHTEPEEHLTASALSESLGIAIDRIEEALAAVDVGFDWKESASNRFMALAHVVDLVERFLQRRLDGDTQGTGGGAWVLRLDGRPESVLDSMRAATAQARDTLGAASSALAREGRSEGRLWTAVLLEAVDLDPALERGVRPGG